MLNKFVVVVVVVVVCVCVCVGGGGRVGGQKQLFLSNSL